MLQVPDYPLILSASRTKDMVHRSPDLLAAILRGETACRWGPHGPCGCVRPADLHSVVLWTKDPRPLLQHRELRQTLRNLTHQYNVLISLQITATGLGGSFLEPGIPHWQDVYATLTALLAEGWVDPRAVVFRFDPFLRVRTPGGQTLSNATLEVFTALARDFIGLGIRRVTTSRADAVRYPRVVERIKKLGLEWLHIDNNEAHDLVAKMAAYCHSTGADFSVCCDPYLPDLANNWGCIDARWLNKVKGASSSPALEIPHNRIGKQRPTCQCTYSRDIGYSTGSATCYSGDFGCLYCYAQGNALLPQSENLSDEILEYDHDPESYLQRKGLLYLKPPSD